MRILYYVFICLIERLIEIFRLPQWLKVLLVLSFLMFSTSNNGSEIENRAIKSSIYHKKVLFVKHIVHPDNYDFLKNAISIVESGDDISARSEVSTASGCLQQLEVYVDEVNRLCRIHHLGKHFSYKDRFVRRKAFEMFDIMNTYKNKDKNILKAIRIHRGKISKPYEKAVLSALDSIYNKELRKLKLVN